MLEQNSRNEKTLELTGEVLKIVSPKEIFLLEDYTPNQNNFGSASHGPLGFGVAEAGVLLLPIVYKLFDAFFEETREELARVLISKAKRYISAPGDQQERVHAALANQIDSYLVVSGVPEERREQSKSAILEVITRHAADLG